METKINLLPTTMIVHTLRQLKYVEAPEFNIEIIDSPPICNLATGYVAFDIEGGHSIGEYQYQIESSNSLIDSELIYNYTAWIYALTFGEYEFVFTDSLGVTKNFL